ncbi:MAG: hypothetical protein ABIG11_07850 [bacterium]
MNAKCLGVFRERTNSPNRENDDALILKAVTEELTRLGTDTHLIEPENIDLVEPAEWDVVLPMCENYPVLKRIISWSDPPLMLNHPGSVLDCYRHRMVPLIQKFCPGLFPETEMRHMRDFPGKHPSFSDGRGAWIKRGDVHNQTTHDVQYVAKWENCPAVKLDFESREITSVVIQEHIPGDLVKFYGVGPMKWFDWFYHAPDKSAKHRFSVNELEKAAAAVAKAVRLEIYGGDAIITAEGRIYIIDINSWPSFARVREEAAVNIARYVCQRAQKKITQENRR